MLLQGRIDADAKIVFKSLHCTNTTIMSVILTETDMMFAVMDYFKHFQEYKFIFFCAHKGTKMRHMQWKKKQWKIV